MATTQVREISAVKDQQLKEAAEKSARSVFVGNIPYEATDEQLKDIFSQAGPVISFRLVYDRETGKPKGYGFCEYKDTETAQSAMRNLNGTEIHGRQLRVDSAASQKGPDDPRAFIKEISPYGDAVNPNKAPETITNAVASLPPEQMFELMKQMKLCIQNNPEEARQMLLQNPQLAYALLQAQVVMKIVDPKVADALLHQPRGEPLPINKLMDQAGIGPTAAAASSQGPTVAHGPPLDSRVDMFRGDSLRGPPAPHPDFARAPMERDLMRAPPDRDFRGPPPMDERFREGGPPPPFDQRERPPHDRMAGDPRGPLDNRGPPPPGMVDHRDPRMRNDGAPPPRDDRMLRAGPPQPRDPRGPLPPDSRAGPIPPPDIRDHRPPPASSNAGPPNHQGPPAPVPGFPDQRREQFPSGLGGLTAPSGGSGPGGPNEEEKQRLIMQVLNLTETQINMLPEDQKESIRLLKSQFASNNTRP